MPRLTWQMPSGVRPAAMGGNQQGGGFCQHGELQLAAGIAGVLRFQDMSKAGGRKKHPHAQFHPSWPNGMSVFAGGHFPFYPAPTILPAELRKASTGIHYDS